MMTCRQPLTCSPNTLAASRMLIPSTWQALRTRLYNSTVYIPSTFSQSIDLYSRVKASGGTLFRFSREFGETRISSTKSDIPVSCDNQTRRKSSGSITNPSSLLPPSPKGRESHYLPAVYTFPRIPTRVIMVGLNLTYNSRTASRTCVSSVWPLAVVGDSFVRSDSCAGSSGIG